MDAPVSEVAAVVLTLSFLGFLRWSITQFKEMMDSFSKSVQTSIEANTRVTNETFEYLKKRNGSLERSDKEIVQMLDKIAKRLD